MNRQNSYNKYDVVIVSMFAFYMHKYFVVDNILHKIFIFFQLEQPKTQKNQSINPRKFDKQSNEIA